MCGTLGGPEVILILVVALIVFGPRRLPEIGKSMGKMLAEFRKASNDFKRTIEDELEAEKARENAPAPPVPEATAPVPATEPVVAPAVVSEPVVSPPVESAPAEPATPAPPAPAAAEPHLEPPAEAVVSRGPSGSSGR